MVQQWQAKYASGFIICKRHPISRPHGMFCMYFPTLDYNRSRKGKWKNSRDSAEYLNWCAILIAHQIVMAKHGGFCVHFSGISTCGRTSRETVSHSQHQPLPTPHKIAVYVTVTNKRLQLLKTTLYNSLVLSFSLLTTKRRLIKHRSFMRVSYCVVLSSAGGARLFHVPCRPASRGVE